MFNSKYKKESIKRAERAVDNYDKVLSEVQNNSIELHELRMETVETIHTVLDIVNRIANKSKDMEDEVSELTFEVNSFDKKIEELEKESVKIDVVSGGTAVAGVGAGVGVAALGPTAAMAIATTFGTASTGTAISALSGAAATNAALAWLGGGALAAGGSGMAGGSAFLALAGPIGWAIGGTAVVGSGVFATVKNKKLAEKAIEQAREIEKKGMQLKITNQKILKIIKMIERGTGLVESYLKCVISVGKYDVSKFSEEEIMNLGSLVNNTNALSKLLNVEVN